MKKFLRPCLAAYASRAVAHCVQNSMFTCFTVSIRKPSIPKSSTHFS
jgi:hypothetical protein